MLLLVPMLLKVYLLLLALMLLASQHHDVAAYCLCLMLVLPLTMPEKFSGLWKETFTSPMPEHVLLEGPENFSGMGECKRSSSRDQKSFPSFMGECKKNSVGGWKHVPH